MVQEITIMSDFLNIIENNNSPRLIIVDFFADWCGPCKKIAPDFANLSLKYTNIGFYKINCDNPDFSEIVTQCQINALPTFAFFLDKKFVSNVVGSRMAEVEKKIIEISTSLQ